MWTTFVMVFSHDFLRAVYPGPVPATRLPGPVPVAGCRASRFYHSRRPFEMLESYGTIFRDLGYSEYEAYIDYDNPFGTTSN